MPLCGKTFEYSQFTIHNSQLTTHYSLLTIHYLPWHCLYFFPLPQGHGSLRPTLGSSRLTVSTTVSGRRPAAAAAALRATSSVRLVRTLLKSVFCSRASLTS